MNTAMTAPRATAPKQRKRKIVSLDKKKARAGWIFVLPFVIGFVLIYVPMILQSIVSTFYDVSLRVGTAGLYKIEAVGFKNYSTVLFEDASFVQTLVSGMTQMLIDIPAIIIFSLFMAVILNQKMIGRAVFRAIFFVPVIVSTGIIAQIDIATSNVSTNMEGEVSTGNQAQGGGSASQLINSADISALFSSMKVGGSLVTYVVDIINNIYNIVNRSGVQLLIFLAGLQSISPAIYESCSIDGATGWETFWKITFPMISPMILVNAVYTIIDSFTSASNSVMSYISTTFVQKSAEATTMAWIYFVLVILLVALVAGVMRMYIFYQRKDG
ncbi:MAG: sugar ABC transporter permease [Clostridia bacterium]|nr:sugar ABC transporter permease [Clostridia bacterium]